MLLTIIRFVGLAVLLFIVYRLLVSLLGASRGGGFRLGGRSPDFKCAKCQHCAKLFDDGALCTYRGRETFKNPTHIANCIDFTPK